MNGSADVRPAVWRWLSLAAVVVLVGTVAGMGLISAGAFDPRPLGGTVVATWAPGERAIGPGETLLEWTEAPPRDAAFTVRLAVARASGEPDIAYGLAIGAAGDALMAAVSPAGYVALLRPRAADLRSWQTWPHLKAGDALNEIWLDVRDGRLVAVRVNRELLWQGSEPLAGAAFGVWAESYGGPASVVFERLELFGGPR